MAKTFKILRIIFAVIAAIIAAGAIFVFVYAGWLWGAFTVMGAAVAAGLMILFKQLQEKRELKDNPPPKKGDFITGAVAKDEDKKEE